MSIGLVLLGAYVDEHFLPTNIFHGLVLALLVIAFFLAMLIFSFVVSMPVAAMLRDNDILQFTTFVPPVVLASVIFWVWLLPLQYSAPLGLAYSAMLWLLSDH